MAWFRPLAGVKVLRVLALTCLMVFGLGRVAAAADCVRPTGIKGTTPHVIDFDTGSAEISAKEQEWLKSSAARYEKHPSVQICVVGQADKTGDPEFNKKLALQRAEAVASFLKENGLADKTYQILGRGEAFGDTGDSLFGKIIGGERQSDRRVEVIFYR